jgi:hypothetical protein
MSGKYFNTEKAKSPRQRNYRAFSQSEDDFLIDNYLKISAHDVERVLGRSRGTVRQRYKVLRLIVPPEIKKRFRVGFKKGNVPWVKGKKMTEFMSPKQIDRFKSYYFKIGHKPFIRTKQEAEVKTKIQRPPAIYSNKSPLGIASGE